MKSVVFLLASAPLIAAQSSQDNGQKSSSVSTLEWCIPMVVVVLAFLAIGAVIGYTVYRQKKCGAFCCLMPKMRYRVGSEEVGGDSFERHDHPSPPPSYDMSHRHIIAPPEYQDALQDILLVSGEGGTGQSVASDSRYTTWSNTAITGTPPDYNTATASTAVLNTESGGGALQQGSAAGDSSSSSTSSITSRTNSLSYTSMSTPPPTSVLSDEVEIAGAGQMSPPPYSLSPVTDPRASSEMLISDSEHTRVL